MSYSQFDDEAIKHEIGDALALIENLRPDPQARHLSRAWVRAVAALSGDEILLKFAMEAGDDTLFWDVEGEIIEQRVTLMELPAG